MKLKKNLALSETGFVFDPSNGNSFATNPIGLSIVKMLKEGKDIELIKKNILNEYLTDANTLEKDIYDFINMLKKLQLNENETSND